MTKQHDNVDDDLHQQDGVVVLASKQLETQHEKRWVARQADPRWPHALSVSQPENALVEPVLGDVAINQRIAGDVGKPEDRTAGAEQAPRA